MCSTLTQNSPQWKVKPYDSDHSCDYIIGIPRLIQDEGKMKISSWSNGELEAFGNDMQPLSHKPSVGRSSLREINMTLFVLEEEYPQPIWD